MKKKKEKDINEYWDKYRELYSFEKFSAIYRELELLKSVSFEGKDVLELGCGFRPFFLSAKKYNSYIAIEPGKDAFNAINKLCKSKKNIKAFNSTFEDWCPLNPTKKVDLIILPGVLHEVGDAAQILKLCVAHLREKGTIYINVPNANSLHRKLAVAMGLYKNTSDESDRNMQLQQNYIFSFDDLQNLVKKVSANLKIVKMKSFFLKPFTHEQMLACVSNEIIDPVVVKGLYDISDQIGDLGSEIACVLELKDGK
jgi:SAM-dependent methyltransferase